MIDEQLLSMMTDTVTWASKGSLSQYGVPTFSTGTHKMKARIRYNKHELRDKAGNMAEARGQMWCAYSSTQTSTYVPTDDDLLTLPDGTTPPVLWLESFPDETGATHHYHVMFGY